MPTLHWIGKEKVVSHHQDVSYKVLEHKYGFNENGQKESKTDNGSKIIQGDNLEALKALLPEYEGRIKCIYIDPPYNTGNEKWVYNDNVNHPKIKKWLGEIVGKDGDDLTRHDKWLCMMYPRLKLLQKLLSNDGAIFVSIDDNEQAPLKIIMDEIFGKRQFIGQYNWFKSATPPNLSHKIKKNIEYVLAYSKTVNNNRFYGINKTSKSDDPLTKPQNSYKDLTFKPGTLKIKLSNRTIEKGMYGTDKFPNELLNDLIIEEGTNKNEVIFRNRFIWVQDKLEEELSNNTELKINSTSLVLSYKRQEYSNEVPPNFIGDTVGVGTTENAGRHLSRIFGKKVFDFPKPPSLIEYIINFLCDDNDIILDSFAGSGTTAEAVLNLNQKDNGNRKFILIEMMDYAEDITAKRVKKVIKGYDFKGKKKQVLHTYKINTSSLKKVNDVLELYEKAKSTGDYKSVKIEEKQGMIAITAEKVISGKVDGRGGSFDFYELGQPIFKDNENLNEDVGEDKIRNYIYYTETKQPLTRPQSKDAKYLLDNYQDTGYYFYYEKDSLTTLDNNSLGIISELQEQYIIYADICLLDEQYRLNRNIIFKKIPRDIKHF